MVHHGETYVITHVVTVSGRFIPHRTYHGGYHKAYHGISNGMLHGMASVIAHPMACDMVYACAMVYGA